MFLKEDYADGQGTYTFPGGEKYEGKFKDGHRTGQRTNTLPDIPDLEQSKTKPLPN